MTCCGRGLAFLLSADVAVGLADEAAETGACSGGNSDPALTAAIAMGSALAGVIVWLAAARLARRAGRVALLRTCTPGTPRPWVRRDMRGKKKCTICSMRCFDQKVHAFTHGASFPAGLRDDKWFSQARARAQTHANHEKSQRLSNYKYFEVAQKYFAKYIAELHCGHGCMSVKCATEKAACEPWGAHCATRSSVKGP